MILGEFTTPQGVTYPMELWHLTGDRRFEVNPDRGSWANVKRHIRTRFLMVMNE